MLRSQISKFFCIFALQLALSVSAFADLANKHLIACADKDFDPFSFIDKNGKSSGYDVELVQAIAKELSVEIDMRLMPWSDCLSMVQNKKADMLTALDYNNPGPFERTIPLPYGSHFVAFGKQDFNSTNDLYEKRIATIENGGAIIPFLMPYDLLKNTITYKSYFDAMQSVIRGENDYCIVRYSVGRRILAQLGNTEIKAFGPILAMSVGINADNAELRDSLNNAIVRLSHNHIIRDLSQKWLGNYVNTIYLKDYFNNYKIQAIFAIIFIVFVILIARIIYYRAALKNALKKIKQNK